MQSNFLNGYALIIGVGEQTFVNDAKAVYGVLTDSSLCTYPARPENVRTLLEDRATPKAILADLEWLRGCAKDPDATVIVYYSGHGRKNYQTGHYYLLAHGTDFDDIPQTALSASDFASAIQRVKAKRLLVFLDCCHAAGMATARGSVTSRFVAAPLPVDVITELKKGEGRAVFSSCTESQLSQSLSDRSLGIYTHHLIEAFEGAGNRQDESVVTVSCLMKHLSRVVPRTSKKLWNERQTPFFDMATEDFPVALLRGGRGLRAGGWKERKVKPTRQKSRRVSVNVKGSGAIAMGQGAVAAGVGGIAVGGDLRMGGAVPARSVFDQRGQRVGTQINVAGNATANLDSRVARRRRRGV